MPVYLWEKFVKYAETTQNESLKKYNVQGLYNLLQFLVSQRRDDQRLEKLLLEAKWTIVNYGFNNGRYVNPRNENSKYGYPLINKICNNITYKPKQRRPRRPPKKIAYGAITFDSKFNITTLNPNEGRFYAGIWSSNNIKPRMRSTHFTANSNSLIANDMNKNSYKCFEIFAVQYEQKEDQEYVEKSITAFLAYLNKHQNTDHYVTQTKT